MKVTSRGKYSRTPSAACVRLAAPAATPAAPLSMLLLAPPGDSCGRGGAGRGGAGRGGQEGGGGQAGAEERAGACGKQTRWPASQEELGKAM